MAKERMEHRKLKESYDKLQEKNRADLEQIEHLKKKVKNLTDEVHSLNQNRQGFEGDHNDQS